MTTTIQISDEVWEVLNEKKKRGDSYDDVLRKKYKLKQLSKIVTADKFKEVLKWK